jgi:hypothetical protein
MLGVGCPTVATNAKTADSSVLRILAVDRYRHVLGCGTPNPILPKCSLAIKPTLKYKCHLLEQRHSERGGVFLCV